MLILPGTPLLLTGVDRREPAEMTGFRESLHSTLGRARTWRTALQGPQVPSLLSLGGLGIDRGVRVVCEDGACVVDPSDVLTGDDLASAVRRLREDRPGEAAAAEAIPAGTVVAVLAALEASRSVRLVAAPADRAALAVGQEEPLLAPLDFSGAAHPDAPLEPRPGAAEFDERLEAVLTGRIDSAQLSLLHGEADAAAACTDSLATVDLTDACARTVAAVDVHSVRYRLVAVASATATPGTTRGRTRRTGSSAEQRA